jgi:dolichyl-phosphate-mannose--protein O-mannosyl transferase
LVVGFLATSILPPLSRRKIPESLSSWEPGYLFGAIALVGGISGVFFFLTFIPNYAVGWWSGISSLTTYYYHVLLANRFYPKPISHQDSPWWSWPLMLRSYKLWQQPDDEGMYLAIWGGGNPAIWWAALVAIVVAGIRAVREGGAAWNFLSIGYLAYLAMFIPVDRAVYLYSYMPALYLAILALAGLLDGCWKGTARVWEQGVLLLPVVAVSLLGLGYLYGAIASSLTLAGYITLLSRGTWPGRFVCAIFLATSIAVFLYFVPLWIPTPLTKGGLDARMWFNNAGLGNWI